MASFEIAEPQSLEEAFLSLAGDDPSIRPIGGGTALMLMMKAHLFAPERLVSLRLLERPFHGLSLSADGAFFRIGAMTTFAQLEHSPEIAHHLPVVAQTMKTLANARVRNVATVGGNLAHADPHLDLPPVWMALDAKARIVNPRSARLIPVGEIFAGYYETTLSRDDLIAQLEVPLRPEWRSTYVKVTTRAAHDWPAIGLAISVLAQGGRVDDLRLVLSAAVDRPTRLLAAESVLRGVQVDHARLREAADAASAEVHIESDSQGAADYKHHLLRVHLMRAVGALAGQPAR